MSESVNDLMKRVMTEHLNPVGNPSIADLQSRWWASFNPTSNPTVPTVLDIQVDATLDPGASPAVDDSYILTDVAALHANFGTIDGVGDDDTVRYNGEAFVISFDASVGVQGVIYNIVDGEEYIYTGTSWDLRNIKFYISWSSAAIVAESLTTSPDANLGLSQRTVHTTSSITTPNGDTLDNYKLGSAQAQVRVNSLWSKTGFVLSGGGVGADSGDVGAASFYLQSGSVGVTTSAVNQGGGHGSVGLVTSAPARFQIIATK